MQTVARTATGSIFVGIVVLALKAVAWRVTGSAALYSDALETVVNVVASGLALWAVKFAAQPADYNHPFGHAKIEFIAAVVEGALIVVAAVSIFNHAYLTYLNPVVLHFPLQGMALNFAGTVLNAGWAGHLFRVARRTRSPALRGDAWHLLADVATGVGILAGVGLVVKTGLLWIDPVIAGATAIYVLASGLHLISQSMGALMDMAPTDDTVTRIEKILGESGSGAIEVHDLRVRGAGQLIFAQFHLVVPGAMSVNAAHDICDRIEAALRDAMPHLVVNIHIEPEHKAKHDGAILLG